MANDSPEDCPWQVQGVQAIGELRALAGNRAGVETMFDTILEALETWQQDYASFTLTAANSMRGWRQD